jgi:formylglycine-generating enzyme
MQFSVLKRIALAVGVLLAADITPADVFHMPDGQKSLEFVTVGDPGNARDFPMAGAVNYVYQIGTYDITSAQYCEFLNAVAKDDRYMLYSPGMAIAPGFCGIVRSGNAGDYRYSVMADQGVPGQPGYANYANYPVTSVSWADAARFCNWLHKNRPVGPQGEGTTETGAYTLNGANDNASLIQIARNSDAKFFLPSNDEWFKAAYYKGGGTDAGYWTYTTRSDDTPSNVLSATGTNNANFALTTIGGYTDPTNYLTAVGAFAASPGPYGTYDQGGNVYQWTDTILDSTHRAVRGCSYSATSPNLRHNVGPVGTYSTTEWRNQGFRIATVPEPGSFTLVILVGLAGLMAWRQRNSA